MGRAVDKVVVSVTDDRLADLSQVVADLRRAGLVVDNVLELLGTVTGSIDPDAVGRLATVPGVAAVQRAQHYRLPPPDAEIQ